MHRHRTTYNQDPMPFSFRTCRWLALSLAFLTVAGLRAEQVDEARARLLATNFISVQDARFSGMQAGGLNLVQEAVDPAMGNNAERVLYRIYNVGAQGFVIISGDDRILPVLGYSTEGAFLSGKLPSNMAKWLDGRRTEIRNALELEGEPSRAALDEWTRWETSPGPGHSASRAAVAPLLQTNWDQPGPYNAMCPGGSVTGCVATAMAMVMKYHNWPAQGTGFHSYNSPTYGTLSANFGATTYNWAAMPNNVTSSNNAVATLMYHCGVSVEMQYSPQFSGAWVIQANSPGTDHNTEYALKNYFNYSTTMQGLKRANYSDTQWINKMKADLDASRPIIYDGFGSGGGHCFVADGYDNNDFFHFNWGWGGAFNGYFNINSLNPSGQGTGGGTGAYNSGQEAIFGIKPAGGGGGTGGDGQQSFNMALYNWVAPSSGTIYYGQGFSVTTNIANVGTNSFSGDYCAAIFDANSNFYGYVQTLSGYSLQPNYAYTNNLAFTTTGLFSMLPGTYYIGIFYRPTNGDWVLVGNSGSYTNLVPINVVNPNDIELNAELLAIPGTTVAQGTQFSVNTNIVNDGSAFFVGQYGMGLYNLDGTWAQDIGVLNETQGLPGGYTYLAPYLTFGPVPITVPPGTYLLAAQHNPNNTGWQLTGSSYYSNPVFVTVTASALAPDPFEVNNTVAQAYALPLDFNANAATVATTGSNLHNTGDQDFYKLVLPTNYSYVITPRLHDSYNSGNGQAYTVDGMFSYSLDGGNTWSAVYDDIMPGNINMANGGTVHFHVAPYFQGLTGTYLLQFNITRNLINAVDEQAGESLRIYPNPAKDHVMIELATPVGHSATIALLDGQGRMVARTTATPRGTTRMPLQDLAEGVYLIRLVDGGTVYTQRLMIAR